MKRYSNDETSLLDNLHTCKYSPHMYISYYTHTHTHTTHTHTHTHTNLQTRTLHKYLVITDKHYLVCTPYVTHNQPVTFLHDT